MGPQETSLADGNLAYLQRKNYQQLSLCYKNSDFITELSVANNIKNRQA
jgi:hypothetical protein